MFVRFVSKVRLPGSRCPVGVFQHAYDLVDRRELDLLDELDCELSFAWFNLYLPIPPRFSRARRPKTAGICWFKADAREFIQRARKMAALLDTAGVPIDMLRAARPGYIVYEDKYQVVAVPFRETQA